ncbi:hypothetical protein D9757_004510 [Collybiopsis confluens]|uniref:NTF2 domain-containing protein n=1 Tax=Collybiopsis confluens TaxID=2823264 RepID=A0A8H5MDV9_9AGAR|nr:hypothetical protein D9757_004510 [Collybiopsis confluens]
MMTSNGTPHHNSAIPSEVGWQFVPQYYNFVNKEPERLHCFYNKRSTFIHGSEGEDGKTCHGQQEIHAQITSLGFQDCKIFIHSVDAQSSADGGIIIQVIGEMSNSNGPWRKFVQTFFLAEQPNGYFVLNDIFRFLKEDSVEDIPDEPELSAVPPEPVLAPEPVPAPAEFHREPSPVPSLSPVEDADPTAVPVEELPVTVSDIDIDEPAPAPAPEPIAQVNGHEIEKPATPPISKPATPPPAVEPTPPPAATPALLPLLLLPLPQRLPQYRQLRLQLPRLAVAHDSRGLSENVPDSTPPASTSGTQTPAKAPGTPSRTPHPAYAAAQSITTAQCFIKVNFFPSLSSSIFVGYEKQSVTEPVSQQALSQALTRFGPLKSVEIVRQKACAFAEFTTVDSAKRAIIASLLPPAGGEGGVKVDVGGGEPLKIFVETRKERGDRVVGRGRGGGGGGGGTPFAGGEGRGSGSNETRGGGGGFRGGGGSGRGGSGRGRGAK